MKHVRLSKIDISKKSLKTPNGYLEAINRRTENTKTTIYKTLLHRKIELQEPHYKPPVNPGAPEE
jgi:hypothetical protein